VRADSVLGTVRSLHRYPVKSLAGESLRRVGVEERGVVGDRLWAVLDHDGRLGSGKSSRRFRRMDGLLRLTATLDGEVPVVGFPDGRRLAADGLAATEAMSAYVGRPVSLGRERDVPHHDEGPVHLVTTSSLAAACDALGGDVPAARMRPNLVLDTGPEAALLEDAWAGRRLAIGGEVVLDVRDRMARCVMVGLGQVDLPREPRLLGTLAALNETCLGVVLDVVVGGTVSVGDEVRPA
jgi:MOSC domain-containing protein